MGCAESREGKGGSRPVNSAEGLEGLVESFVDPAVDMVDKFIGSIDEFLVPTTRRAQVRLTAEEIAALKRVYVSIAGNLERSISVQQFNQILYVMDIREVGDEVPVHTIQALLREEEEDREQQNKDDMTYSSNYPDQTSPGMDDPTGAYAASIHELAWETERQIKEEENRLQGNGSTQMDRDMDMDGQASGAPKHHDSDQGFQTFTPSAGAATTSMQFSFQQTVELLQKVMRPKAMAELKAGQQMLSVSALLYLPEAQALLCTCENTSVMDKLENRMESLGVMEAERSLGGLLCWKLEGKDSFKLAINISLTVGATALAWNANKRHAFVGTTNGAIKVYSISESFDRCFYKYAIEAHSSRVTCMMFLSARAGEQEPSSSPALHTSARPSLDPLDAMGTSQSLDLEEISEQEAYQHSVSGTCANGASSSSKPLVGRQHILISGGAERGCQAMCVWDPTNMTAVASSNFLTPQEESPSIVVDAVSAMVHDEKYDRLFVGTYAREITVVHLGTRPIAAVHALSGGHEGSVTSLAYDPQRMHLFSGSFDMTICIWAVGALNAEARSNRVARVSGQGSTIRSLLWVPSRRRLLSTGEDGQTKEWDISTGAATTTLDSHQGAATQLHWQEANGQAMVVSGGLDGYVKVWAWHVDLKVPTGSEVRDG